MILVILGEFASLSWREPAEDAAYSIWWRGTSSPPFGGRRGTHRCDVSNHPWKVFCWKFAFHFILHFLCILFVHLQIVNLERVGEGNLCGTECNIDVRYLDHCFWVLPILELMRVNGQSESYKKRLASFVYLDIVLDGVVNLAEDKFSRQKLIIFSTFFHQIALH